MKKVSDLSKEIQRSKNNAYLKWVAIELNKKEYECRFNKYSPKYK